MKCFRKICMLYNLKILKRALPFSVCPLLQDRLSQSSKWRYISIVKEASPQGVKCPTFSYIFLLFGVCPTFSYFWVKFLLFRCFKFTLKPPYSIACGKLRLAIWDTSFWTFWLKFGHKGP